MAPDNQQHKDMIFRSPVVPLLEVVRKVDIVQCPLLQRLNQTGVLGLQMLQDKVWPMEQLQTRTVEPWWGTESDICCTL